MNEQIRNEIIRLYLGGTSRRRIARLLRVSRRTVGKTIGRFETSRAGSKTQEDLIPHLKLRRKSRIDEYVKTIEDLLSLHPDITAVRLLEELRFRGFQGGYTIVRERLNELRPSLAKNPVERFETAPGRQAQMDYSPYTIKFEREGTRAVHAFSYLLSYSRREYLRFVESEDFETTVREHKQAFQFLGGVAHTCLYDGLKVVVSRFDGEEPIYNERFLAFATHYGFRPWACRRYRPQTKGKVERRFDFIEKNLLNARTFRDLDHLNEVATWWVLNVADLKPHRETKQRPIDRFEREREFLLPLPERDYDVSEIVYRIVNAEGLIQWRSNYYPVPWNLIGRSVPVKILESELIVYDLQTRECARHPLFPRNVTGQTVPSSGRFPRPEGRQSKEALAARFRELGAQAQIFFEGLLKQRRYALHEAVHVLELLHHWHHEDILRALERAVTYRAFSYTAIERILAAQATPLPAAEPSEDWNPDGLQALSDGDPVPPRQTSEYQDLLDPEPNQEETGGPPHEVDES